MSSLKQCVAEFIEEQNLLQQGARVVLGVSGGPDSMCLLDILQALAPDWQLTLHVAHLNHGWRAEAAREAEWVRARAAERGLAFHTETVDARAYAAEHKQSPEEAARTVRYAFLAQVAQAVQAGLIAVAHTADDQAETVLMHFLRGAGLAGLRGMVPSQPVDWPAAPAGASLYLIRPLLSTTRREVEAYCAEHALQPRQDATNLDPTYWRNQVRHQILPELEKYQPHLRAGLGRMAAVLAGEYALAQKTVDRLWAETAQVEPERVLLARAGWQTLTVPEQRALLRRALGHLRPGLRDIDFAPVESAVRFSRQAETGRTGDIAGGLKLVVTEAYLIVCAWENTEPPPGDWPQLTEAGQLAPGWKFVTEDLAAGAATWAAVQANPEAWTAYVDADKLEQPLGLRPRRAGDRYCPLGLGGQQKIAEALLNAHIDQAWRDRWPVVVSAERIVWLPGVRVDERFKVTPETRRVKRLKLAREDECGQRAVGPRPAPT